ncbi:MAG: RIP metalloprotease RseP [Alphaproteobacteria bacterium CG11_big_fil_rev_8_21_14_0_20_39_49]|nr:MAG: RIP metalloprotease RseP [Alphaproteobacteria bacterium CG11_big_fil_rev_8_21_14_0_20_39_49]
MEILTGFFYNISAFVVILSVIVFVHEFGHYFIAKISGVKIEQFSIGFGKEIFGVNDKSGTRWKFCALPFGGYVKMFGDIDPASAPDSEKIKAFTEDEKKVAFHTKSLPIKSAVVFAGPAANFILAIVIMTFVFSTKGKPVEIPPKINEVYENSPAQKAGIMVGDIIKKADGKDIGEFADFRAVESLSTESPVNIAVERNGEIKEFSITPAMRQRQDMFGNDIMAPFFGIEAEELLMPARLSVVSSGSAAEKAGLMSGDLITEIEGIKINSFSDLQQFIAGNKEETIQIVFERDGVVNTTFATPTVHERTDSEGNVVKFQILGVSAENPYIEKVGIFSAFKSSIVTTYDISAGTLKAIGQMFTGQRSPTDISGPIGIAKYSGQSAKRGLDTILWFIVVLSINLGLVNLFPIPLLDGGHLMYYAVEAVRGKPLADKVQQIGFKIGIALVGTLFIFAIVNDLYKLL